MRILYIDIDTLRSDHLGCARYHCDTTPNIDAIAANGVRFANVYSSDVPCLPSRTALISGMEALNLMRGMGGERADEALPSAHKWIAENGRKEDWFLHVHLWDPHTPYNTPQGYGNPFADDPIAGWHT